jgi:UDP-N-acetylglucosamine--N-acetylmuramyl-(pentapeptide) pyrophosphoryl-undecaprenol N-acetylglucosamine transferase
MKVLAAGGGSGGHVTPVLAVINELGKHDPNLEVRFVCDRKFSKLSRDILSHANVPVDVRTIPAGKFRRYHGISIWRQMLDIPTAVHNFADLFLIAAGYFASLWQLMSYRPDVVFTKGGFVCLPVGLAAATLRIPLVIHDSDSHPGLTNRILARFARLIATGAPLEHYSYSDEKATYVGIPVDVAFQPVDETTKRQLKETLGLPDVAWPLVVVTGGGLGAARVNQAMIAISEQLLDEQIAVLHITGSGQYDEIQAKAPQHPCYIVKPFVADGMAKIIGAADVVVTRAGATSLLEVASMAKPTIIVPNAMLTGGHQVKNASVYEQADAALVIEDKSIHEQPQQLLAAIELLIHDHKRASDIAGRMHEFARPNAAFDVAELIVRAGTQENISAQTGEGR